MRVKELYLKYKKLKENAGTHSPSISTLISSIPEIEIDIDACFLSNPYATKLFFEYFKKDLVVTEKIYSTLEYYPSQNSVIAEDISRTIGIDSKQIFVCNGAIEGIQAVLHNVINGKLSIPIPTFSSYYEFCKSNLTPYYYQTSKEEDYCLNLRSYQKFIDENEINNVLIINPSNPVGSYLSLNEIGNFIEFNKSLDSIIIDESFIHFSYESKNLDMCSVHNLINKYDNLVIVKSMSKDFGIAGLRAGYVLMNRKRVASLLEHGYLWNVSGLTEYFFKLLQNVDFRNEYEDVRKEYLLDSFDYIEALNKIKKIKIINTKANFVLIEILNGKDSEEVTLDLLFRYGVYVRSCSDKIGLTGQYIRVAARSKEENLKIVSAFKEYFQ